MGEHAQVQMAQTPASQTPAPAVFPLQRKCACGTYGSGGECDKCRSAATDLHRSACSPAAPASMPAIVDDVLSSSGQPLDSDIREWMEPRFGHDFSHVRIHTDQRAAESAQAVNALAYTVGHDVVFNTGRYQPGTESGGRLLAHELTHVVQQGRSGLATQTAKEISHPSDAAEVEADSVATRIVNGETVTVTQPPSATLHALSEGEAWGLAGGIVGGLGLLGLTLYLTGVFDKEHFSDDELIAYLTTLATTRRIENTRSLSDNKARDVVRRWTAGNDPRFNLDNGFRATGGSLTGPELKRLLIEEMLSGPTTAGDENAIITIVRRSTDRLQIVNAIGREHLWSNFSGRNRRIIEALTLTDNEFNDTALVDRLKALPADELADYRDNAVDPAVRARIVRILQLQRITTPLGIETPVGADGVAHPVIPGFDVNVAPDTTSQQEQYRNQAHTGLGMDASPAVPDAFVDSNNIVQSTTVPGNIRMTIQTTYGPGADPSGPSGYGRGSTPEDIAAGQTSLRFHEGHHGLDLLEFLRTNPAPRFGGQIGMTQTQWRQAEEQFRQDTEAYYQRAIDFTVQRTECVGRAVPPEVGRQYYNNANICRTVGGD